MIYLVFLSAVVFSFFIRCFLKQWMSYDYIHILAIQVFIGLFTVLVYSIYGLTVELYIYASLYIILIWTALVDYKNRMIPNRLIVLTVIIGLIFMCINMDKNKIIYCVALTVLLFLVSFISKGALGMGDVKLIGCMCLFLGSKIISILLIASLLCCITGIVLVLLKNANRKTELPFSPFIMISLMILIIIG
ncbi:prepilin peptidase [Abyssisolibacter fermentans]|uniref:prepilin peptidase n=1 Tax=Abyssisolibacter fermentans TaxID=1766203 RepID=UPI000835168E|nr:prepilin peptidase [Abyssisolibacter fermentans]